MNERREISILLVITLAIGLTSMALITYIPAVNQPKVFVEKYSATFYFNGTLVEEYTYRLKTSGYHFLFRSWEAPLSTRSINEAYIRPVKVETVTGAAGYVKDHQGNVFVEEPYTNNSKIINGIATRALRNEAGSYHPIGYLPGIYHVEFAFVVHMEFHLVSP